MHLSRIVSLKGFDGVLVGRDLAKVFKPGKVYGAQEIDGVILIQELGDHALNPHLLRDWNGKEGNAGTIQQCAMDGVTYLTTDEYTREKQRRASENEQQ